jgi:hypothetical protein
MSEAQQEKPADAWGQPISEERQAAVHATQSPQEERTGEESASVEGREAEHDRPRVHQESDTVRARDERTPRRVASVWWRWQTHASRLRGVDCVGRGARARWAAGRA